MSALITRRVDIADAIVRAAISSLHAECFEPEDNPYNPPAFGQWWITFRGKEAVAFAGIIPSYQWLGTGYLCRAGVLPAFRGNGLQCELIKRRVRYAQQQGWHTAITDTNRNPASANSLIKCGFRLYEPRKPWGFSTALYWKRELA